MKVYNQMSLEERKKLYIMKKDGAANREIAKTLGRHRSTIYNELKRNTADRRVGYLPDAAENQAQKRKAKHGKKLDRMPELKQAIIKELSENKWSPEVIAGRLKLQSSRFRISHETIYQFVYSDEGKELRLFRYLLKARPRRGHLKGRTVRKTIIPDRVSIHDRPKHIENRAEFGHLEGDLTFFTNNQSMNIAVIVERKSRFVQLIPNKTKQTTLVIQGIFNKLASLPSYARKSLTLDNGLEFAKHTFLKKIMGIDTYFCDKHSPWQKGQVEQTNVMLHRYLPKKSNLKDLTNDQIEIIQNQLNNRPRKCLGFKTPTEVFNEQLYSAVALRA